MWADPAVAAIFTAKALAVLWLGAFVGGFASGATGFAFGVVASAVWLHVFDPLHSTMLIVSGGLTIQCGTIWPMRREIDVGRLAPFAIAGLFGLLAGIALLLRVDALVLKFALGIFLAAYGIYALTAPRLPHITGGGRTADAAVGFVSGILGGLGGYSGVLPAIWCQLRGWPKDVARGVYQPVIIMSHIVTLALIGAVALDRVGVVLYLLALPMLLLGAFIGWRVYGKLDERRFRQTLAALLVLSGVALVI